MSDESNSDSKQEVLDLESLKVTELKKRLKSFGLSVAGNKSELIERLQNAMDLKKEIETPPEEDDSALIIDTSESLTLNESENYSAVDLSLSSSEKELPKEQPSKSVDSTNSNPASIPLKKRAVAQAAMETVKVEKKIVLNRNNIPTPIIFPIESGGTVKKPITMITMDEKPKTMITMDEKPKTMDKKPITMITMDKTESADPAKQHDNKSESFLNGKSVIRLSKTPATSELEKLASRGERFKADTKDQTKSNISATPLATTVTSRASSIPSSANLCSIEALKRRAERFGQTVSSRLKKVEEQERILKRKSKFGNVRAGDDSSTAEEQEKRRKRIERFGI